MTRVQVKPGGFLLQHLTGRIFDVVPHSKKGGWFAAEVKEVFLPHEVRVLGRHEGEYDPNHWGELDPDAYDRLGHNIGAGKHLLDTGVN